MKLAGIAALMMTLSAGCSVGQETGSQTSESLPFHNSQENIDRSTEISQETIDSPSEISQETIDSPSDFSQENVDSPSDISQENDSNPPEMNTSDQDTIYIGGKVRSISEDSFVISRTLMEDSMVIMPEAGSPEEVLVTIRYNDSTSFEHWTIQGGGEDIVKKEAAFSDIKVGGGLEALGYFNGDEFIAEKIIIELYK